MMSDQQTLCRVLFEQAGDAILIIKADQIIDCNLSAAAFLGYSQQELLGTSFSSLVSVQSDEAMLAFQKNVEAAIAGWQQNFEWPYQRSTGETVYVDLAMKAIEVEGEIYIWVSLRDIGRYKQLTESPQHILDTTGTASDLAGHKQVEEALKQQQLFMRQVLDINPHFIFAKDRQGRFVLANKAFADAYGTTIEALIGKTDADFNPHSEMIERYNRDDMGVIETGQELFIPEEEIINIKGERLWRKTVKRPIFNESGQVTHVLGVATDITDRKRVEQQLRERERFLQLVMDYIPQFIFWKDRNSVYLGCNQNFARIAGIAKPEEIIGKTDYDLVWRKEEADAFRKDDQRIMAANKPELHIIEPQLQAGGKQAWLDTNKVPLHDANGNVIGILGAFEDITERKRIEESLRESEARNRALLDAIPDFIFRLDRRGEFLDYKAPHEDELAVPPDLFLGKRVDEVFPGEMGRQILDYIKRTLDSGQRQVYEYQLPRSDGKMNDFEGRMIISGEDEVLVLVRNITDRKQLEQQTRASLERRGRQVRLSTLVAHDIAAATNLDDLYQRVVTQVKEQFGFYHAQLLRYQADIDQLVLVAGYGEAGQKMMAEGYQVPLGSGLIGTAASSGSSILHSNVADEPGWQPDPHLPDTKGEIAVPIKLGSQILGVLDVQSDVAGQFDAEDQLALEGLSGQIAVAIENTRLLEETNIFRQFAESSGQGLVIANLEGRIIYANPALAKLLGEEREHLIGSSYIQYYPPEKQKLVFQNLPILMREGHWNGESLLRTTNDELIPILENSFIIRDEKGVPRYFADTITDISQQKLTEAELEARLQELNTLQRLMTREGWQTFQALRPEKGYLFDQNNLKLLTSESSGNGKMQPAPPAQAEAQNGHSITKPVAVRGEVIGQIGIYNDPSQPLVNEDQEFLDAVAEQVAEALERARLLTQIQKRAVELEAVAQVSTVASTTLETDKLLQTVVNLTKTSFDLYHAHIYLVDETGAELVLAAGAGEIGQRMVTQGWRIPLDHKNSLVALAARTQRGVIANDVRQNPNFLPNPHLPETRSELAVPMIVGNKLLGVLDVQADVPNRFTDEDAQTQMTLAAQVAVALQNANLYQQTQVALAETETLYDLGAELSAATTLDEALHAVATPGLTTGATSILLLVYELDSASQPEWAQVRVEWHRDGQVVTPVGTRFYLPEFPFAELYLNDPNNPMLIGNTATDKRLDPATRAACQAAGTAALVLMPLTLAGRWVGLVTISWVSPQSFTVTDQRLYRSLMSQAAVAINNLLLFEEARRQAVQLEKLSDIEAALSQATDETEIVATVARAVDSDQPFRLALQYLELNESGWPVTSRLIASWRDGALWLDDPALGLISQVDTLPMTQLWINSPNTPVFVTDSQSDSRIDQVNRDLAAQLDIRSIAIVPLYAAGAWQGVLTFLWSEPHYFSSTEQFMLQRLLDPIASVVASRRAYAAQQETLANTEALYVASRRINEATDLQEVLAAVAQVSANSIINRMIIFMFERDSTDQIEAMTVVAHWDNGQGYPPSPIGRRYAQAEFSTVQLMASPEPLFFEDVQADERVDAALKAVAKQQNIRAMAVLPLQVGGRRLGVLLLQSEEVYQFSERDIQIYLSLAPQIASTLENQRLLEETRTALATVEAIQRRYTIQTWSEYQTKSPVQGYQKVGEQLLPLADEPLPVDVTPVMNHKQTLALSSGGDLLNGSEYAEVEEQRTQEDIQASLIVPLTIRNEVIGVLGLQETAAGREWQPEEIALVEAIAEQLALAAENIRLLDETQQRAARERRVNEIGEKIQAAQSLEEALQIAVREVGLSLQAPQTIVQLDVQ